MPRVQGPNSRLVGVFVIEQGGHVDEGHPILFAVKLPCGRVRAGCRRFLDNLSMLEPPLPAVAPVRRMRPS